MAADHLLVPRLELGELDGLHLIEVHQPPLFGLGALEPALQAFELSLQQLIIRLLRTGAECGLALHQRLEAAGAPGEAGPTPASQAPRPELRVAGKPVRSTRFE